MDEDNCIKWTFEEDVHKPTALLNNGNIKLEFFPQNWQNQIIVYVTDTQSFFVRIFFN